MTDDRGSASDWERIDRLFQGALGRSEAERDAYLEAACDDLAVRDRVRALLSLEGDAREQGFLETNALVCPPGLLDEVDSRLREELPPGSRVGRYRIVEPLGQGGTATVYLAERDDGAFRQRVAVKVVRSDVRPDELALRVRTERQILASLSHPNLAKVFDGGLTEDGRPFLVVELVEGKPIDQHSDGRRLSVRNRLRLFLQVARAVQHAHQNLIVHRDLKPSNILVTPAGHVKLLDFGIAKLLEPDLVADPQATRTRWMTPHYAAPEQILGRPVTTATDVHALGVVLYELLTGRRPFGSEAGSTYSVEKAVCETDPIRPSAAVTGARATDGTGSGGPSPGDAPATSSPDPEGVARARSTEPDRLRRTLGGDLDAIILKALRKEPEARYGSAEELIRDIARYLDGRPVAARGDAPAYRVRKFASRHWAALGAAALVLVSVLGSAVALAVSRSEVLRERDRAAAAAARAEAEAEDAQAVVAFLADVFRGRAPDTAPGDTLTALELVEWGEDRVETEFRDDPELRADLLGVMGHAYENLGFAERADTLLQTALELRREVHGPRSLEVVPALFDLADNRRRVRESEASFPYAREARSILESHHGPDDPRLAPALVALGLAFRDMNATDSAGALLERAIELERRDDGEPELETQLALAYVRRAQDRPGEAEALYRSAIPRFRAHYGEGSHALAPHLNNFAYVLKLQGDYAGADTLYREALTITADAYGRGHPNTINVASNLAAALEAQGRDAGVDSLMAENLRALQEKWGESHWRVGRGWANVGIRHLRRREAQAALEPLSRAVRIYETAIGADHYWTVFTRARLGMAQRLTGDSTGQRALDAAHSMAASWYEAGNGTIRQAGLDVITPLYQTLRSAGLGAEAQRFGRFLPADLQEHGGEQGDQAQ